MGVLSELARLWLQGERQLVLSFCRTAPSWAVCTICLFIRLNSDDEQAADFVACLQEDEQRLGAALSPMAPLPAPFPSSSAEVAATRGVNPVTATLYGPVSSN